MVESTTADSQNDDMLKVTRYMSKLEKAMDEFFKKESATIVEVDVITKKGTLRHPYPVTRKESASSYGPTWPYRLSDGRIGVRVRIGKKRYVVAKTISEFVSDTASMRSLTPKESIAALKYQLQFFQKEPLY